VSKSFSQSMTTNAPRLACIPEVPASIPGGGAAYLNTFQGSL